MKKPFEQHPYLNGVANLNDRLDEVHYREINTDVWCRVNNVTPNVLTAIRHLGGVQADQGRSNGKSQWLIKGKGLKTITVEAIQAWIDQNKPAEAPAAEAEKVAISVDQLIDQPALDESIDEAKGGLEEWAQSTRIPEPDPAPKLLISQPFTCKSITVTYQNEARQRLTLNHYQKCTEDPDPLITLETDGWHIESLEQLNGLLADFSKRINPDN